MVKLYSYSSELLTFVETRWVIAKFATAGALVGIVILFGIIELNHSVGFTLGSHSTSILASENNFLRQQVNQISPKVSMLEMQETQLNERADNLRLLLHSGKIVGNTVSRFTNATKEFKSESLILATKSYRP
jgi:hypothetical protein